MNRRLTTAAPDWAGLDLVDDPVSETLLTDEMLCWFESGLRIGWADGYAAAEAEMQQAWSAMAAKIRALGKPSSHLSHAELCERRGEPERAARGRRQSERVMTS